MNAYQEKKQAKIERYQELAKKARTESDNAYMQGKKIADMIPFGQPILVGHHSEKHHRRDIGKINNSMDRSITLNNKADYYENKAHAAEKNTAISSDDPNAIELLKDKLVKLEKQRVEMKAINSTWRKYEKTNDPDPLYKLGFNDEKIKLMCENVERAYSWEKKPYASYQLTNLGATIRQVKQRIEQLETRQDQPVIDKVINGTRLLVNKEQNRIQLFFDGKPEHETRQELKRNGFRWSPTQSAWQAYPKQYTYDAAVRILESLSE